MLRHTSRGRQRGLSLVELMVGVAVGLFVVAGATLVTSTQLGENRRLLLETQLQQDLRASADIMTRELRRAGAWDGAEGGVWDATDGTAATANPYVQITPDSGATDNVEFLYRREPGVDTFGFKLDQDRLWVRRGSGGGTWQDLTDVNIMKVTAFSITPAVDFEEKIPCPRVCVGAADPTACWPTLQVRSVEITINAESANDDAVQRSITSRVRLPNDALVFNNGAEACPS